jgi:hypothetical protein
MVRLLWLAFERRHRIVIIARREFGPTPGVANCFWVRSDSSAGLGGAVPDFDEVVVVSDLPPFRPISNPSNAR